jgi:hypothetical protein
MSDVCIEFPNLLIPLTLCKPATNLSCIIFICIIFIYVFSGRSGAAFTLDMLANHGITSETGMPPLSAHTVTVPGAAAGWVDTVETFGSGKVTHTALT